MPVFLHAADIHLDSPLLGLDRHEGAPADAIRGATRSAFDRLVQTAIDRRVDFVVIAGDLYDGDWNDCNTGLYFTNRMVRLREAGIKAYLIRGNHDAANRMTKSLRLPDNVTMLSVDAPQTITLDDLGVAIHGQGFATRAVTDDLSTNYPAAIPGMFNLGLLHTSADGREGHERYAPCSIEGLKRKGYDYWALGHIHAREILSREDEPPIVFPGNVQGRHARETGAKGCLIVSVERGRAVSEFVPLDVVRWERLRVDVSGANNLNDVLERFADELERAVAAAEDRLLAVRVELSGACVAHDRLTSRRGVTIAEIRNEAMRAGADRVWVEKVEFATRPLRERRKPADDAFEGPIEVLSEMIQQYRNDSASLAELAAELDDLRDKLPAELVERDDDPIAPRDPKDVLAKLDEIEGLLRDRLFADAENE